MAMFMLSVFLFSMVPISALADESTSNVDSSQLITNHGPKALKWRVGNNVKYNVSNVSWGREDGYSKPTVSVSAIEIHNQAKERFGTIKTKWETSNTEFKTIKAKITRIEELGPKEKEEVLEKTRKFVMNTLERMENHLEILEAWANRIDITEERRGLILDAIYNKSEEIKNFKDSVENAEDIATLREISSKAKESWKGFTPSLKKINGELLSQRLEDIVERSHRLSESLHKKIDELDQSDESVEKLQFLLVDFDEKVSLAEEQLKLAREKYSEIETVDEARRLFQETKEYLNKAKEYLREAHNILRDIVQVYRLHVGEVPVLDTSNVRDSEMIPIDDPESVDSGYELENA